MADCIDYIKIISHSPYGWLGQSRQSQDVLPKDRSVGHLEVFGGSNEVPTCNREPGGEFQNAPVAHSESEVPAHGAREKRTKRRGLVLATCWYIGTYWDILRLSGENHGD